MASDLDEERRALSARNERMLQQFGLKDAFKTLGAEMESKKAEVARRPRPPKRPLSLDAAELSQPVELRRSNRFRNEVNYNDDQPVRAEKRRRLESVDVVDIERHQAILAARRARAEERAEAGNGAFARGPRDSGKGRRTQMGKVYDSRTGVTCHWCRQKTVSNKVMCTRPNCGGGTRMPIYFCDRCLLNRHGEDISAAISSGAWVCPCCRGSCGLGCVLCCNCGPCRKKANLPPTGQLVVEAQGAGYSNAHDYLVGRATGASQAELTARKHRQVWASWMTAAAQELEGDEQQGAGGSGAEEASEEPGDEAEEESGLEAEEESGDEASGDEATGDEAEEASEDGAKEVEVMGSDEPLAQGPQIAVEAAPSAAQRSQEVTKPLQPGSAVEASVPAVTVAVAEEQQDTGEHGSGGGRPSRLRRSSRIQPGKPAAPGPAAVKTVATVGSGRKVRGSPKLAAEEEVVSSPGELETGGRGSSVSPGAGGARSAVAAGLLEAAGEEAEVVAEEEIKVEAGTGRKRMSAVGKAGMPAAVTRARAGRRMTT